MTILVWGVNHKSAPVEVREHLAFNQDQVRSIVQHLVNLPQVSQAVLLTTCNRTEIYCDTQQSDLIQQVLAEWSANPVDKLEQASYVYQDLKAVEHIMRVACGLDSLVLGETEILGQMKEAVRLASTTHGLDQRFHALFQRVFALAKQVRTSTDIGICPVSVASIAVQFIKQHAIDLAQSNILLLGSGHTMSLALKYLAKQSWRQLTVLSRSADNAYLLAQPFDAQSGTFQQLPQSLNQADIVLSATASDHPILTQDTVAELESIKPRIMVDMAIPRDIEPDLKTHQALTLYSIDDLSQVAQEHVQSRQHAAQQATVMIRQQAQEFMNWLESLSDLNLVKIFRRQVDQVRQQELDKAKQMLSQGNDPEKVLERLAYSLSNKLMHEPTVQMRQASLSGRKEVLKTLQDVFALCNSDQ